MVKYIKWIKNASMSAAFLIIIFNAQSGNQMSAYGASSNAEQYIADTCQHINGLKTYAIRSMKVLSNGQDGTIALFIDA